MQLSILDSFASPVDGTGPRTIAAVKVLRVSVTDRCNFRCTYCMPEGGVRWLPKESILSFEEIADVVRAAVEVHGINRFKLTGGEPTVRHGLTDLVRMLRRIPGVAELSMTTNGARLVDLATPLREAGLDRLTISLDSLRPDRFEKITRTGDLAAVMRGLDRAEEAGFDGLKINCVAMRGVNDDEFANFARLAVDRRLTVRFIEYMPLGDSAVLHTDRAVVEQGPAYGCGSQDRGADALICEAEIRDAIEAELGPLTPIDAALEPGVGPAVVYALRDPRARGRLGFISAMSTPFCSTCNRLRLTANGVLRSCLFEGGEVDILPVLRAPQTGRSRLEKLADAMTDCVRLKPAVHTRHGTEQMSRIGG